MKKHSLETTLNVQTNGPVQSILLSELSNKLEPTILLGLSGTVFLLVLQFLSSQPESVEVSMNYSRIGVHSIAMFLHILCFLV